MKGTDAQLLARLARAEDEGDEDLADEIEQELDARAEYRGQHADSPSLQDAGYDLGSYAS